MTEQIKTQKPNTGSGPAMLFFKELMENVETLTGIADQHSARTLADVMYLQNAVLDGSFIELYPDESAVLKIVDELPSAAIWRQFIQMTVLDSPPVVPESNSKPKRGYVPDWGCSAIHEEIHMQEVMLSIPVKTNASVTPEAVAKIVQRLIDIGLADAGATLEDSNNGDDGDIEAAQLATDLNIGAPVVAQTPRVLVVISGGITDPISDDGVDVEVFDWDNYKDDPEGTGGASSHFADLAIPCDIPVKN